MLAFAVGAGRAPPQAVLGANASLGWIDLLLRTLYFLGILVGGGAAVVRTADALRARRPAAPPARAPHLLRAARDVPRGERDRPRRGAGHTLRTRRPGRRDRRARGRRRRRALAALRPAALRRECVRDRPARRSDARRACARPRPDEPGSPCRSTSPTSRRRRSGSAGSSRSSSSCRTPSTTAAERSRVVRRFSTAALASVCVLALSGLGRALTELHSVSQVWSTSYGRALIVKSAIFLPLLGLGWLNRTLLLDTFARLRRSAMLESVLLLAIVVAVAVLTELRPGVSRPARRQQQHRCRRRSHRRCHRATQSSTLARSAASPSRLRGHRAARRDPARPGRHRGRADARSRSTAGPRASAAAAAIGAPRAAARCGSRSAGRR